MILGNCIIERAKLRKAALDKEKEERDPSVNGRHQREIYWRLMKETKPLQDKAFEIYKRINALTDNKISPSDEDLILIESLGKEFARLMDEYNLALERIKIQTAAFERERQEQAITTTLTTLGTMATDFWGWIVNPTEQQHDTRIQYNNYARELLPDQEREQADSSTIGMGIENDGGTHALISGGGGDRCETNSDDVLVPGGVGLYSRDASGINRLEVDNDGIDGGVDLVEMEGTRHPNGWNFGEDMDDLESPT
ncbi:hypothetical protein HDU76_014077 [Blyttiomyces sp. JEL0837]|nr:hypothetical protein HDU76_014077 [Blyttiomyces sp. JEL0837]